MPTSADFRELRVALELFVTEYVAYLEAANRGDRASASRHRQAYNRAIPRADIALNVAGRVPWMAPPPLAGGGEYQPGLSACVRIIEQWHSDPTPLLDTIEQAHATLAEYERHPPRTRRSLRLPRLRVPELDATQKVVSILGGLVVIVGAAVGVWHWAF